MTIYTIYRATCDITDKVYIGFDSHYPRRQSGHKGAAKRGESWKFSRAIRKHGWEAFHFEPIYQSLDKEHTLKYMEPYFIKEYDSLENGYNMTAGGEGTLSLSQESRDRKSIAMRGKNTSPKTEEHKQALRKPKSTSINMRGPNPKLYKPVSIGGIEFISMKHAAEHFNTSPDSINYWVKIGKAILLPR